jgi:hypothetical protein
MVLEGPDPGLLREPSAFSGDLFTREKNLITRSGRSLHESVLFEGMDIWRMLPELKRGHLHIRKGYLLYQDAPNGSSIHNSQKTDGSLRRPL